jgi:hypothetical protein
MVDGSGAVVVSRLIPRREPTCAADWFDDAERPLSMMLSIQDVKAETRV